MKLSKTELKEAIRKVVKKQISEQQAHGMPQRVRSHVDEQPHEQMEPWDEEDFDDQAPWGSLDNNSAVPGADPFDPDNPYFDPSEFEYEREESKRHVRGDETFDMDTNYLEGIEHITEQALKYKDLVPGADGDFIKFADKVDKLITDLVKQTQDLHQEGEDMLAVDILGGHDSSAKVGERNRYILARVGFLKSLVGMLTASYERLRREV